VRSVSAATAPLSNDSSSSNATFTSNRSDASSSLLYTAFCGRDAVRAHNSAPSAVVPFTCVSCPAGQASFGGVSGLCQVCDGSATCLARSSLGAFDPWPATGSKLGDPSSSSDVVFSAALAGLNLTSGSHYLIAVSAITEGGVAREVSEAASVHSRSRFPQAPTPPKSLPLSQVLSEEFGVDATPPLGGVFVDGDGTSQTAATSGESDLDYTSNTSSYSASWAKWADPESGVVSYRVGASSAPCDGVYHRACVVIPPPPLAVSPGCAPPPPTHTCSDLEIDRRAAQVAAAGRGRLGTPAAPLPFDWASGFDVAPLTEAGLATEITFSGLNLTGASIVYGCLEITNGAGVTTVVSTDGVVIDVTPPTVLYVADGFRLPDVSTQVYTVSNASLMLPCRHLVRIAY
jgi:hypothetical protein